MNRGNNSILYQFIPFSFPILAIVLLITDLIGTYTLSVFVVLLLLGFTYSFCSMISKKGLIGAIINMYIIGILIFGSGVMYIMTIASEV
ncbi:hypothetical protein [Metabacillus litoralis]|uniref:hypothetical protein n=1 Tax=Metabacillus litoralis TaxID=152268 RepID=UPI001CFEBCF7|nr:hypothetical protein [Metabacillus litoralis]